MKPLTHINPHIASPWDFCKCGVQTFSVVDLDSENKCERMTFKCPKCGPVQVLYSRQPNDSDGRKRNAL